MTEVLPTYYLRVTISRINPTQNNLQRFYGIVTIVVCKCLSCKLNQCFMCICYHFIMQEPFNFSDTIDGSALSYTITYKRSNSSTICATTKVQATSCLNQTCEHTSTISNFSDCLTSSGIMVTVFGMNKLGNGSDSIPVLIGSQNL